MMRRIVAVTAAFAVLAVPAARAQTAETPYCTRAQAPKVGLTEVGRKTVGERVLELSLRSEAMGRVERADVLLPRGYDSSGRTRYAVLYLLHGAFGNQSDWLQHDLERMIGDLPLIVVMPNGGKAGSYTDWYGTLAGTPDPAPAWETHHVRELLPYVDATFPTVDDPSGRFIAGLSMGGAGAMKYAAANPGLFGAAGEFSGAVNTTLSYPIYPAVSQAVWLTTLEPASGPAAHCTWGDPVLQQVVWRDNDPTYLAENLAGTALFLTSGDGNPGELDGEGASFDVVEWTVNEMNKALVAALDGEGIQHTDVFYGAGTHTWPYWTRDLERFLAWLAPRIGRQVRPPASFSVRSARERFAAWGWSFRARRDVREFAYLDGVSRRGLTATGSGRLDVVTPPLYVPGREYVVDDRTVVAGDDGELRFTLDLGPSHRLQQLRFGDRATSNWTTVRVRIRRAGS